MMASAPPADLIAWGGNSLPRQPTDAGYPVSCMATRTRTASELVAIGGTSWVQRSADPTRCDQWLTSVAGRRTFADIGGTVELALGTSAATTYAAALSFWTDRFAAGWDAIVCCTLTPSTAFDAAAEAQRLLLNDLIRNNSDGIVVADIAALPQLAAPADPAYMPDGTHYNAAAVAIIYPVVNQAIDNS